METELMLGGDCKERSQCEIAELAREAFPTLIVRHLPTEKRSGHFKTSHKLALTEANEQQ